jgi:acyl carrier protein|tara:strand:+ start:356 stop:613 length:258 start_codon:yes stop_codon:yes gene_type:complete
MKKNKIEEIEKILLDWFKKNKKKINRNQNFFEDNVLDSFDIIEFITFMEKKFSIKFDPMEYQNQYTPFSIIKNLSKIIKKKIDRL